MLVIGGSASTKLAEKISKELDCRFAAVEKKSFPDGEVYVRIPVEVEGEEVLVVQSTCYPPNQNYMELFLILDALNDLKAEKVSVFVPYFGYARQDKRFKPGEAVSFKTVAKLIESAGPEEIYVMDIHGEGIENSPDAFQIPAFNLTAAPILSRYVLENYELESPIVLGPDEGAKEWARKAGKEINSDWDFMVKKRLGSEKVEITPRGLDVENREVIILDDIISTGGTMAKAIEILREHGSGDIYACCTHPVLSNNALKKIENAGAKEVIGTDTIPSEVSKVSVAPVLAENFQ